jgi:hypothetical protein
MKTKSSLLFAFAALVLTSCTPKKSELVLGTWKVSDISAPVPTEVPDSLKQKFAAQMKMQIEEMKKSTSYEFSKDGSFNCKMMGQENKGNWRFSEDGSKFIMSRDGRMDTTSVVELSKDKFIFEVVEQGDRERITLGK